MEVQKRLMDNLVNFSYWGAALNFTLNERTRKSIPAEYHSDWRYQVSHLLYQFPYMLAYTEECHEIVALKPHEGECVSDFLMRAIEVVYPLQFNSWNKAFRDINLIVTLMLTKAEYTDQAQRVSNCTSLNELEVLSKDHSFRNAYFPAVLKRLEDVEGGMDEVTKKNETAKSSGNEQAATDADTEGATEKD